MIAGGHSATAAMLATDTLDRWALDQCSGRAVQTVRPGV